MAKKISLPPCDANEITYIFEYILFDNPIVFYVSSFTLEQFKHENLFYPRYIHSMRQIEKNKRIAVNYLHVFERVKNYNDLDKELFIHDYCLNYFDYDYKFNEYSYSILGAVLQQSAVCEGISKFVKFALDSVGVKSLMVKGEAVDPTTKKTESHAWNIVNISNRYFHLDVTFDMTLKKNTNRYDYFNLSDEDMKKDHIVNLPVPKCINEGFDYYMVNNMTVSTPAQLSSYIEDCLTRNQKNIHVKLQKIKHPKTVVDKVIKIALDRYIRVHQKSASIDVLYNITQGVFELNFKNPA